MTQADNGRDLVLTLSIVEGLTASFQMKPWQAEGMATVVTYGRTRHAATRAIHREPAYGLAPSGAKARAPESVMSAHMPIP